AAQWGPFGQPPRTEGAGRPWGLAGLPPAGVSRYATAPAIAVLSATYTVAPLPPDQGPPALPPVDQRQDYPSHNREHFLIHERSSHVFIQVALKGRRRLDGHH